MIPTLTTECLRLRLDGVIDPTRQGHDPTNVVIWHDLRGLA